MNPLDDEKQRVASLLARMATSAVPQTWEIPHAQVDLVTPASAGDDCAVVDFSGELSLVCGSDYVRGSKFALFERGLLSHYELGYYLVAANLSDIAAMGAQPIGILTVVRYPRDFSDADFEAVLDGAREAANRHGCELLGGDTGGPERLILSGSALGICERGTALLRSEAQPADRRLPDRQHRSASGGDHLLRERRRGPTGRAIGGRSGRAAGGLEATRTACCGGTAPCKPRPRHRLSRRLRRSTNHRRGAGGCKWRVRDDRRGSYPYRCCRKNEPLPPSPTSPWG